MAQPLQHDPTALIFGLPAARASNIVAPAALPCFAYGFQNSPPITLGRDAQNDVVIMDRKASRLHARIERRRDKFVIVDVSSNGTYCTMDGESEILLRREELILRGSGRLSFGHPGADNKGEGVEYVCL